MANGEKSANKMASIQQNMTVLSCIYEETHNTHNALLAVQSGSESV